MTEHRPLRAPSAPLPGLTGEGRALLAGALALLVGGATGAHPVLVALAAAMLGLLAASFVSARLRLVDLDALDLALTTPEGPTKARGEVLRVRLAVRNRGARSPGRVGLRVRVGGEPTPTPAATIELPHRATAELPFELRFPRAGHWFVHGVEVHLTGVLGLADGRRYLPCEEALHVRPKRLPDRLVERVLGRRGAMRDHAGRFISRQAGSGLELRELRDYVPGDALKTVAWKATARRQRPLVRAFEEETVRRIQLLVDIGPTMRAGDSGQTPLDRAIDLAASIAEIGVNDRIGLTTFDTRVYGHLKPGAGRGHLQRQLRHLMDLSRVVDEDLTETSESELLARVGAFLEAQHGLRLRRAGEDPWTPRVARTLVDPLGEVYDPATLYAEVTGWLARERDQGHAALYAKSRPARQTRSARLRLFCALRGLPVSYRLTGPADATDRGLVEAIGRNLTSGGADLLVLLSDLRGLDPAGDAIRSLRLARAHKKEVLVVAMDPAPPPIRAALNSARAAVVSPPRIRPPDEVVARRGA